jgi:hypothetical protein
VTLNTYAHLLGGEDDRAADVTADMMKKVIK